MYFLCNTGIVLPTSMSYGPNPSTNGILILRGELFIHSFIHSVFLCELFCWYTRRQTNVPRASHNLTHLVRSMLIKSKDGKFRTWLWITKSVVWLSVRTAGGQQTWRWRRWCPPKTLWTIHHSAALHSNATASESCQSSPSRLRLSGTCSLPPSCPPETPSNQPALPITTIFGLNRQHAVGRYSLLCVFGWKRCGFLKFWCMFFLKFAGITGPCPRGSSQKYIPGSRNAVLDSTILRLDSMQRLLYVSTGKHAEGIRRLQRSFHNPFVSSRYKVR